MNFTFPGVAQTLSYDILLYGAVICWAFAMYQFIKFYYLHKERARAHHGYPR